MCRAEGHGAVTVSGARSPPSKGIPWRKGRVRSQESRSQRAGTAHLTPLRDERESGGKLLPGSHHLEPWSVESLLTRKDTREAGLRSPVHGGYSGSPAWARLLSRSHRTRRGSQALPANAGRWPLEAGNGEEANFPLERPEGPRPSDTTILGF